MYSYPLFLAEPFKIMLPNHCNFSKLKMGLIFLPRTFENIITPELFPLCRFSDGAVVVLVVF